MTAQGRILVVVLNFNGYDDTIACLDSLAAQTADNLDILVIDNGSRGDEPQRLAAAITGAEFLALPENLGWAGGNNVGMRLALDRGHAWVCLLNNDTVLEPATFEILQKAAAIIAAPCLLQPAIAYDAEPERWQLYPELVHLDDLRARELAADHDIVRMTYAYGACLLIPRALLQTVGLLDERFFLQLEEIDYFLRAGRQGIRSYCARRARMLHKESPSFGGLITPGKAYYQVRNQFLIAEKHHRTPGGYRLAIQRSVWALYHQAQATGAGLRGRAGLLRWLVSGDPLARAARDGAWDYLIRRFGARPVRNAAPLKVPPLKVKA